MHRLLLRLISVSSAVVLAAAFALPAAAAEDNIGWAQWGQNQKHQGNVSNEGQAMTSILADKVYDPFTQAEEDCTGGDLLVHYQVPLLEGNNVFMEFKSGAFTFPACDWNTQIWNEKRLAWEDGNLVEKWNFQSDWKPEPKVFASWEPVFHAVLAGNFVYVPGAGGTIFKVNKTSGANLGRINPFVGIDPNTFVAGPLTADGNGNIYYNVIKLDNAPPTPGLVDSWLVKVTSGGSISKVSYATLMAPANPPTTCQARFSRAELPWPRGTANEDSTGAADPNATPPSGPCGAQRPGLNIAPAIASDGTIYVASRGHWNARFVPGTREHTVITGDGSRYAYLVAVNPNLTLKWAASLRDRLNNGCGVLIPIATRDNPVQKGKCRWNTTTGVDPETNGPPAGRINDAGTASPTILPDGNVLFGAWDRYNVSRGNLFKFSSSGQFQASFDFGWDDTLAIVPREDNNYSIVMKDNHYDEEEGFYCNKSATFTTSLTVCDFTGIPAGPFYITQVNKDLQPEWKFQSTETRDCHRNPDGSVTCVDDGLHPNGFEWCINAPAVDGAGNVYVESEDGFVYVLDQGHSGVFTTPKYKFFTNLAVGAAYTPFSIDRDGRLYAQNNGHLFVLGEGSGDVGQNDENNRGHRPPRHDPDSGGDD